MAGERSLVDSKAKQGLAGGGLLRLSEIDSLNRAMGGRGEVRRDSQRVVEMGSD